MHTVEPFYNWRAHYVASEDGHSPFYGREYSEFEFTNSLYDHAIHPQWDTIDSPTLFVKVLFVDYDDGYTIIELMGEWNDLLYNDIMLLKRELIDAMTSDGINKFVLLGENVLNFHSSDDCYYEEWFDDVEDGWIAMLNFRDHVMEEFENQNIDQYLVTGGSLDEFEWRTYQPVQLFEKIAHVVEKRLGFVE